MANPPPPKMPSAPKKAPAPWRVKMARVPPWFFLAFVAGGLVQVYLAGFGIENLGAQGMDYHLMFAHVIEFVPLLILIFGFLSVDWRAGVGGVVLLVLFQAQYFLLEGTDARILAGHAFNGVLMIVIAMAFLARRWPWAKPAAPAQAPAAPKPMVSVRPAAPPVQTPNTPRPPTPPQR